MGIFHVFIVANICHFCSFEIICAKLLAVASGDAAELVGREIAVELEHVF